MTPFWTVSLFWAAAVVCILIALAFVLPALLRSRAGADKAVRRDVNIAVYRDQMKELEADRANGLLSEAQFETARLELETRLADDALSVDDAPEPGRVGSRRLGLTLGAVLPVAAFGLYFWLGNPTSLMAVADAQPGTAMAGASTEHDFMQMLRQIEEKTRANPKDGEAWFMLGKTYAVMERWPDALPAFEQAASLLPQDASVLSSYAEALAITSNYKLAGRPMELIQQALEIDPDDMKGLELAGIHAYQLENFPIASNFFKRLLKLLPPGSPHAVDIQAALQEAERLAQPGSAGDSATNSPSAADQAAPMAPGASIKGRVEIAPALKTRLLDTDVVFLFARAGQSGPPVAAMRATAGQLPLEFELNDSMAMNPGNTLAQHKQVVLVARVSKSGNPMAQPGDLEGTVSNVAVGASGVKIVIDQVRP
jgi:cytochrome c-type biogenesis protein CcmH